MTSQNNICKKNLISIVIPVYNEEYLIEKLIDSLLFELSKEIDTFEIILVDDGSHDGTWEEIQKCHTVYPQVGAIRLSKNFGKESALRAGIESAVGNAVITLDADMQHPLRLISKMIEIWRNTGANVVEAVKRERPTDNFLLRILAFIFYKVFTVISGLKISQMTDYKLIDRAAVNALLKMRETELFYRGMISWIGFRVERIFFSVDERASGKSKWPLYKLFGYAFKSIASFSAIPLYLMSIAGVFYVFIFGLISVKAIFQYFQGIAIPGYTTIIILLMLTGAVIMLGLAIIGLYLNLILTEIKSRPVYLIMEQIKSTKPNLENHL
jgi:glycosyltransferase involved in cell wall biosynthesis